MENKKYIAPEIEIVDFEEKDIVTESGGFNFNEEDDSHKWQW